MANRLSAWRWWAVPLALAWLLGAGALGQLAEPKVAAPKPRLIVVSWDGAAFWVVDRLLAEGRLPHLAASLPPPAHPRESR